MIFNEPDPVVPWTEGLEADFLNGCGYPLRPRLASLFLTPIREDKYAAISGGWYLHGWRNPISVR